jgi:hypothetical protein
MMLLLKQIFHQYQLLFLIPGVLAIITAHVMNIRFCRISGTNSACAKDGCRH